MNNSNWLSVFGRDYYTTASLCAYSAESLNLDGLDDAVAMNTDNHWPMILSDSSATRQHFVSMWVRSGYTSAGAGLKYLMTQSRGNFGDGSDDQQYFRLAYEMMDDFNDPQNQIYVTYRDNTIGSNNNAMERIYPLHGANNTTITGASNDTDYWLDNNTTATSGSITTNSNDFVHLCAVVTTADVGTPYGMAGAIELYWNGQKLIDNNAYTKSGVGLEGSTSVYSALGCDISSFGSFFKGQIDEVGVLQEFQTLGPFKTAYSLSSEQDVVDKLYNTGCPGDVTTTTSAATAGQWNYNFYRFESPNNWLSESSNNAITPQNGATTTTTHHA